MRHALHVALALGFTLAGCGKDVGPTPPGVDSGTGGQTTQVSGHITSNATWSGAVAITGATTIDPGVTVTVMAGTAITAAAGITISGTLDIEGTSAAHVTIQPAAGAAHWGGFNLAAQGTLTTHYLFETGAGLYLTSGATATIIDSQLSHQSGDLLVMGGGTIDVEYSWIGVEKGMTDTTHCDIHVNAATSIKVTHSNLSTGVYGIMFYAGQAADFTFDNWFANSVDVATSPGVTGSFDGDWFEKNDPPSGAGITAANLSSTRLTDAGPRP